MSPKKPGIPRWVIGVLAAFGTIAILVYAGYASDNKKDDRPAPLIGCSKIASQSRLGQLTNATLRLNKTSGNSTARTPASKAQFCDYTNTANGRVVAQTASQNLTTLTTAVYRAALQGHDDSMMTSKVPASRLPAGVDDGYFFTPADLPADLSNGSVFKNSGVTMRADTQTVTVSFKDFGSQLPAVQWDFMYAAAQQLESNK